MTSRITNKGANSEAFLNSFICDINFFWRTDNALLPDIIRQVFAERLDAKAKMKAARNARNADEDAYWDFKQASKKLIINSCYGVFLNAK